MTNEEFKRMINGSKWDVKYYMQAFDDLSHIQKAYKASVTQESDSSVDMDGNMKKIHTDLMSQYDNAMETGTYNVVSDLAAVLRKHGLKLIAVPTNNVIDRHPSNLVKQLDDWAKNEDDTIDAPVGTFIYDVRSVDGLSDSIFEHLSNAMNGVYSDADAIRLINTSSLATLEMLYESGQLSCVDCEVLYQFIINAIIWSAKAAKYQLSRELYDQIMDDLFNLMSSVPDDQSSEEQEEQSEESKE